ncbi:SRPBCC domain-containing protein [Jiulongibacter sediminis]|jgi:uncharacterized protein YndB with AHSA1/START domain|uniref:SRPBCC domain-containing protein n=1 Tax=Jiulongibacter sediminis TaxID=1605367 RepID=UPI0026EDF6BF|nr:SRPBCC domain-containing protein [Jiulongibacter sediminis]
MTTEILAEPGKLDFYIKRMFRASLPLVYRTFTEKDLFVKWFMPGDAGLTAESMNCREGGSFHLSHSGPGGMKMGFKGVYHEVSPLNGIIKTSEFIGLPQKLLPVLEMTTFNQIDEERTEVTIHTICPSVDYRDNMISAGMKPTLDITHFQLQNLLDSLS